MNPTCPKCGAESPEERRGEDWANYLCGSMSLIGGGFAQSNHCVSVEPLHARTERLRAYVKGRRLTIEGNIASEKLAGNEWKEACERAALAEITALEIQLATP